MGLMPSHADLSDRDREELLAYLYGSDELDPRAAARGDEQWVLNRTEAAPISREVPEALEALGYVE